MHLLKEWICYHSRGAFESIPGIPFTKLHKLVNLPKEQLSLTSIQKNYNFIKCWISQFTNLNVPDETKSITTLPSNKRNFLESFWTSKLQPSNDVSFYFRFVACATILLIFRGELAPGSHGRGRNMNHPHFARKNARGWRNSICQSFFGIKGRRRD